MLQDVLSDALSQTWTPAQEAILGNEAGMETVIDAVGRVNAAAQVPAFSKQLLSLSKRRVTYPKRLRVFTVPGSAHAAWQM